MSCYGVRLSVSQSQHGPKAQQKTRRCGPGGQEISIDCSLPELHLFAHPVLTKVLSDAADGLCSRLHPVLLAFQLPRSVQHYVRFLTVNVLGPRRHAAACAGRMRAAPRCQRT